MENNKKISLEMMLLTDLLKTKVIDETIFAIASKRILSLSSEESDANQPVLATA